MHLSEGTRPWIPLQVTIMFPTSSKMGTRPPYHRRTAYGSVFIWLEPLPTHFFSWVSFISRLSTLIHHITPQIPTSTLFQSFYKSCYLLTTLKCREYTFSSCSQFRLPFQPVLKYLLADRGQLCFAKISEQATLSRKWQIYLHHTYRKSWGNSSCTGNHLTWWRA